MKIYFDSQEELAELFNAIASRNELEPSLRIEPFPYRTKEECEKESVRGVCIFNDDDDIKEEIHIKQMMFKSELGECGGLMEDDFDEEEDYGAYAFGCMNSTFTLLKKGYITSKQAAEVLKCNVQDIKKMYRKWIRL